MLNVEYNQNRPTISLVGGTADKSGLERIGLRSEDTRSELDPVAGPLLIESEQEAGLVQRAARKVLVRVPSLTWNNPARDLAGLA